MLGALAALKDAGFRTEYTDPLWIAKAFHGPYFIDLIFSSGNGIATVDERGASALSPARCWACRRWWCRRRR